MLKKANHKYRTHTKNKMLNDPLGIFLFQSSKFDSHSPELSVEFLEPQTWQNPNTAMFLLFISSFSSSSTLHLYHHSHPPHDSSESSRVLHGSILSRRSNDSNTKPDISRKTSTTLASPIPRNSNSGTSSTPSTGWALSAKARSFSTAATRATSNGSPKTPASSGSSRLVLAPWSSFPK